MPRDWRGIVAGLTDVQKLVHLAMRMDSTDEEAIRGTLLRERRRAYEGELTLQARRIGCGRQMARLGNGPILSALNDMSKEDARSIVATYNYDLAFAIRAIGQETPTANRHTYAKRLQGWEAKRASWKNTQIAEYTENSARSRAQQDFYQYNHPQGVAVLLPKEGVCPVCKGWIKRGRVDARVAQQHPPPYHPNCPHVWDFNWKKFSDRQCENLWMGE